MCPTEMASIGGTPLVGIIHPSGMMVAVPFSSHATAQHTLSRITLKRKPIGKYPFLLIEIK